MEPFRLRDAMFVKNVLVLERDVAIEPEGSEGWACSDFVGE